MINLSTVTVEESGNTKIVKTNGVEVDISANGDVVVHTAGHVELQPVAANDTTIGDPKAPLEIGQKMQDGSVFAGLTADGRQQIYTYPSDLGVTKTFNDAAKAVEGLNADNALGHNDWQIPSLDNLHILQKNQNEGSLEGTFKTDSSSGSGYPDW